MSQNTFDLLQELSESMQGSSCLPKEPFITLQSAAPYGVPTLNYKMPQKSGFKAYGHFVPKLAKTLFKSKFADTPSTGFYQMVRDLEDEVLEKRLREELLTNQKNNNLLSPSFAKIAKNNLKNNSGEKIKIGSDTTKGYTKHINTGLNTDDPFICDIPIREIIDNVQNGNQPVVYEGLDGRNPSIAFVPEPTNAVPTLFVIEEYTVASYLGDYGAGKTLKTMSLLPGEKTTITIRTYKESVTTRSQSENVLEAFTEDSVREIQAEIENESAVNLGSSTTVTHDANVQAEVRANFGVVAGGIEGGYTFSQNNSANQTSNINALARSLDKHVENSNNHREVNVNTTTESTVTEGEEQTIVRELQNYNKSRVLNFVFRQLLQEYVTLTYLSNIRIGFTTGYIDSNRVVDIEELDTLLDEVMVDETAKDTARTALLKYYCKVKSAATGELEDFIEAKTIDYGTCFGGGTESYWGKKAGTLDTYTIGGLGIDVPGIILNIQSHILRTDSVVVDALLGQGEALDCFNLRLQDAEAMKAHLMNAELLQKMNIVDNLDPAEQPAAYKKVFGECCENPQTQVIS